MTATLTRLAFRTDAKPFAGAVAWAAKRLPARPTVPTLAGILLQVTDGQLTVSAFDYDVSATATLDVPGASDGAALVSGRLLNNLAATFDGRKPLDITSDGDTLTINYGGRVTLPTMPHDDYPQLPALPPAVGTVDAATFARAVEQVALAVAHDDALKALLGIQVRLQPGGMQLLASDRYRGAIADISLTGFDGPDAALLVPGHVLASAAPALADTGGTVTVSAGGGLFGVAGPGRSITSRLIDEDFPPVERLFPAKADTPIVVPAAELIKVVKRADLVRGKTGPVRLTFTPGQVDVATTSDDGNLGEPVPVVYDGPDFTMATNPTFLIDALHGAGAAEVELSFTEPKKPFLVTAPGDDTYRHLVMPVRLS